MKNNNDANKNKNNYSPRLRIFSFPIRLNLYELQTITVHKRIVIYMSIAFYESKRFSIKIVQTNINDLRLQTGSRRTKDYGSNSTTTWLFKSVSKDIPNVGKTNIVSSIQRDTRRFFRLFHGQRFPTENKIVYGRSKKKTPKIVCTLSEGLDSCLIRHTINTILVNARSKIHNSTTFRYGFPGISRFKRFSWDLDDRLE